MPRDIKLELRCEKNNDGSIKAESYENDGKIVDSQFFVDHGNCDDIRSIYRQLQEAYPDVPIAVGQACIACIVDAQKISGIED